MRLIDADAIDVLEDMKYIYNPQPDGDPWYKACDVWDAIEAAPTIEARPVVRGEWISLTHCSNAGVYCSVCHKKVYKEDYAWANRKNKLRSDYCPNCGADMRGDGDGET